MTAKITRPLLLMGCGKMGSAMLDGWLSSDLAQGGIVIVDPTGVPQYQDHKNISIYNNASEVPADLNPQVIILAVKPQQMDQALATYAKYVGPDTLFVSIAAGKTLHYFENHLGSAAHIVRAMPNTPAAIGQGITVICPNANVTDAQANLAMDLLRAVGDAERVDDESMMDAVTALSGGGPAYVFYMIECLTEAGIKQGLSADLAAKLALVTVAGAGQLAITSDDDPSQLRKNVTSPAGTTLEAINILMQEDGGLSDLMTQAIAAATARSKELAE